MRHFVVFFLFIMTFQFSNAQDNWKSSDFIICIDEEFAYNLMNPFIIVKKGNNILKRIKIRYQPGGLSMNSDDHYFITHQDYDLFLTFNYEYWAQNGKNYYYSYDIKVGKYFFDTGYVILKIYNMDKKKYKRRFRSLEKGETYIYELDTSNGQMLRK